MAQTDREIIDGLIAQADARAARIALAQLWLESPDPATAAFVVSRFQTLRPHLQLTACRVAILRSFTVEPIVPLLRAMAFLGGIDLEIRLGDFNAYAQEILDSSSWLYGFLPDVVIIAAQTRDIVPALWRDFADLDSPAVQASIDQPADLLRQLIDTFRSRNAAHLVVHSMELPAIAAQGTLDGRSAVGQSTAIRRINDRLGEAARAARNVYVLDYDALVARRGRTAWHDERKWLMARMPIAAGELINLAKEWLRFLHPICGRVSKVLAVDLDNTLWGGVIGEEGMNGIKLDDAYPGAAYRALQRAILDLHRRGVILAICSKNNSAEAIEAIEKHPGMLLRLSHFAAIRINWTDKAVNLREIAVELNVGIDAVAFLDDNPAEREWVRGQLPDLTVIELPDDPMRFADALRDTPQFERLELTEEDKSRGQFYAGQRMRMELEQSSATLEDFYRSLQMRVSIQPVRPDTLARAAQLTQKTNQFNLTTRRYSEQQLDELLASPQCRALTIQVVDRFGDNGIVGVAIVCLRDGVCEIDTFLLSCRVIGRTVETAFLAVLAADAKARGAGKMTGWFIPTKKNAPAADFYEQHGFAKVRENEGSSMWELDLAARMPVCPDWIALETTA